MEYIPRKILVLRFSSLGDIVLTTPILTKLRRHYPEALIHIVVKKEFQDIVSGNPNIDKLIAFDNRRGFRGLRELIRNIRQEKYDLFIDVHRSLRSRLILWTNRHGKKIRYNKDSWRRFALLNLRWNQFQSMPRKIEDYLKPLAKLGISTKIEPTQIFFSNEDATSAAALADAILQKKISESPAIKNKSEREPIWIALAPGAAHFLKKWPLEKYKELIYLIMEKISVRFLIFGGPQDKECSHLGELPLPIVNLQGTLTLKQTAALISRCRLLIGNDSGLSHVAEAVGVDAFVFFGPTTRHFGYAPYRSGSRIFERQLSCRPCSRNGRGKCKNKNLKKCLENISSTEVAEAVVQYIEREKNQ